MALNTTGYTLNPGGSSLFTGYHNGAYDTQADFLARNYTKNAAVPGSTGTSPMPSNAIPAAPAGAVNLPYASNTTLMAGPNGPFSGLGGQLQGNAGNILTAGNNQLNQTYDPSGSLYKQALQQEQNQTNVNEAQRGITMSPYGAGVANQADIGFNSDWTNMLQDRQIKNLTAAEGAMNPARELYSQNFGSSTSGYNSQVPGAKPVAPQAPQQQSAYNPWGPGGAFPNGTYQPGSTLNNEGVNYGQSGQPQYTTSSPFNGTDPNFTSYQPGSDTPNYGNPSSLDQTTPQQFLDQYTGGTGSQYPLNGPTDPNALNPNTIDQFINNSTTDSSGGLVIDNSWNQIMSPSTDVSSYYPLADSLYSGF